MTTAIAVDLFGGPGGFEVHADALGLRPIGVEWDRDACATRRASGLHTIQRDVASLEPRVFADVYGQPEGVIGSPPCPLFSSAGKGQGRAQSLQRDLHLGMADAAAGATRQTLARRRRHLKRLLVEQLREVDMGYKSARRPRRSVPRKGFAEASPVRRADVYAEAERLSREMTLVWAPAYWVAQLRPRWVALEQVPPVLPLWQTLARALEDQGYRCWAGILSAERYGVPQTRKRAFMLASLDGTPHPPDPTHQEFVSGQPAREPEPDLFGPGLLPWVSMAQALGWGSGRAGFPRRDDLGTADDGYRERDFRHTDEPAFTLTDKARSAIREADPEDVRVELQRSEGSGPRAPRKGTEPSPTIRTGAGGGCGTNLKVTLANGTHDHRAERDSEEPAPTLHFGGRLNSVNWEITDTGNTRGGTRDEGRTRHGNEPAAAITTRADQLEVRDLEPDEVEMVANQQPNASLPPGHKLNADDIAAGRDAALRSGNPTDGKPGAVRVTEHEAAILQSFPATWRWKGTRTAIFQQIGNAVPPGLARPVVGAAMAPTRKKRA